jgi:hypothetical protein
VLILGDRYGWVGPPEWPSRKKSTAKRSVEKPVFVFVEAVIGSLPEQFVRQVQDYISGHWRKTFGRVEELEHLVQQALNDYGPYQA